MTLQPGQEDFGAVCPYLGLADDADSHATYATEAHRCYRLPNPTRIATGHQETYCLGANHVSCPVYLGEGVPGAAAPAAAAPVAAVPPRMPRPAGAQAAGRGPAPVETQQVRGPRPAAPQGAGGAPRGGARRPSAGAIGPRPRSGGVSMPVATVGLFALALVVIGLAFVVNKLVDNGGNGTLSPADTVRTQTAQKTAAANGQSTQPAGQTASPNKTPGTQTPGASTTATNKTPSASTTPSGKTYTVQAGDTCGAIATANNITLKQLEDANGLTDDTCLSIQVGQVLKLP